MARLTLLLAIASSAAISAAAEESVKAVVPDVLPPLTWRDFEMEMVLGTLFVLYIVSWYRGKQENLKVAKRWMNAHVEYLEQQFALVGDKINNQRSILMKDGPADYLLYTTGRRNVQFGHWWIKLKPRNDALIYLLTRVLAFFGYAKRPTDRVTVDITLAKEVSQKFVFAILSASNAKDLRENRFDLKSMTRVSQSSEIPSNLTVYSESQKMTDMILATKLGQTVREPSFESLVISSMPKLEPKKYEGDGHMVISLAFELSTGSQPDTLVQIACELPDIIKSLHMTPEIQNKLRKNREDIEKQFAKRTAEERAEELARKKAEAKKAEEERVKKLSPTEQRKWEEKERAREMKKAQKKRTKRA
ncbi:hypothetical protein DFQ28_001113 [Apophysomyces sp. BC1034]|nr:hypothetical protein DFQ30_001782 [Apophysomyces sp. BC1015]KAG0166829.1 hypothetical protein DFQ29_000785 [Apophysomyces sp. BC1021]KAG0183734.1 hypothetical protein DFQ28_001113 [Apophysomyces sp. BC1034]